MLGPGGERNLEDAVDIAEWLQGLGLGQYAPAFAENAIHWDVLPKLTADDLKEIGVGAVGDRRRLLEAIASLGGGALPAASAAVPSAVFGEAERRQLTVMFCDLVGSTPLAARFDPEDLREIVGAYHRCVAETVGCFGGYVAKYMGDGVLVYFGYPQAHEEDAERAVRAGLALIDAVGRLDLSERLAVRLGIACGLVVVGGLIGEGTAQERGVVGETANLAARLQALAAPGTLVIAASTRRQIGALFELDDLGPRPLAGFPAAQRAWRVRGESGVVSRFEALRSGETPLVGRDEELELLLRRWQQAKTGEGQVVLICGEPGIGKSRLIAAIASRVKADRSIGFRWFCSPHHQDSALYPVIVQLEHAAGFARQDAAKEKLSKLKSVLAPGGPRDDELALLSELLSLPNAAAELNLSPQKKREALFAALTSQLAALARHRPLLATFEDAHWIDPTSRELLDLMVEQVRRLPVLLVVTFRPEYRHGWGDRAHVTMLMLNRLSDREAAVFARGLAGNAPLGSEIVEAIVERTDGVPLFVEELTKAVLERADQDNRIAAVLSASPLPALAVPPTLHASLIARLDRIGAAAREVAQIGSVLGREFSYELIEPAAQRSEAELQTALTRLADAGLLFCRGAPPHATYQFKHALVQDTAYGTLLRTRRQELHARVAAVLEEQFSDLIDRHPELLAHHLTGAGKTARAVDQWLQAGRHAAARSSHLEAIGHFGRGLAFAASLPQGAERDRREIQLQLGRGVSLLTAKGFTSAEAVEPFSRARDLCETTGDTDNLFPALWNVWLTTAARNLNVSRPLSDRLLTLAATRNDRTLLLEAHHCTWANRLLLGEPEPALAHCDHGRSLYDFDRHQSLAADYGGHDAGVCGCNHGAWSEWLLGFPERAVMRIGEGRPLAERLAQPLSLHHSLSMEAALRLFRGEPDLVLQCARQAEAVAIDQRLAPLMDANVLQGRALIAQGAVVDGIELIKKGSGFSGGLFGVFYPPYHLAVVSEALCVGGDYAGAAAALAEAAATMEKIGERWWEAEIQRIEGILLLARGRIAESTASFERATRTAQQQRARSLELRACTSLARLFAEQGRRTEAQGLLAPVYGWFTEGFDTVDLREAAALLAELA
jgi:class 3 adenylate cyclase